MFGQGMGGKGRLLVGIPLGLWVVAWALFGACLLDVPWPAVAQAGESAAAPEENGPDPWPDDPWSDDPWGDDPWGDPWEGQSLADPLEPLNRVFFTFNDRLYVWALAPVARGYAKTLPEDVRLCVRRFFRNLLAPVRAVNHLLQGRARDSGAELVRFAINSTIGIAGLVDPAVDGFGIRQRPADMGQTLGVYGFGEGLYLHWPFLGPSSLRDSFGMVGDSMVNPVYRQLLPDDPRSMASLHAGRTVNTVSLNLGEYERITGGAFDPYIAVRDAYWQYRRGLIQRRGGGGDMPAMFGQPADGEQKPRTRAVSAER